PVVILFNKTDLLDDGEMERMETFRRLYTSIGYTCYAVSVVKREGLEELPGLLKDKITLVAGNSGVGKSALLNALVPTANAATASISDSHNVGMHTTTFSEMYDLPGGGSIIDIPGVKGFGTFDFEPQEVSHYFREIFNESQNCKYSNCMHLEEPHCAVRQAIAEGRIAASRYQAYLSMLGDKDEDKYRPAY
ncbi:MAG: ribosome small subunit-dependent GTPase A, partial [Bacteroidaceae bacterium]|nr:ribosome small subunit-dependent GTPase A [Bacteroidaceae bacterium]